MKNKKAGKWVRLAAYIVGSVSAVLTALCVLGLVFVYGSGTEEEALDDGYGQIAENYMAYILSEYFEEPGDVIDKLYGTNLYYTIIKDIPEEDGYLIFDDKSTYVYTNVPEGEEVDYVYTYQGNAGAHYRYNTDNLISALRGTYSFDRTENWKEVRIQNIVLDISNGMFYLKTPDGYFLCDYVYLKEDGLYYDYQLETVNDKRCYYNAYYDRVLDTNNYANWTGIGWVDDNYVIDPNETDGIFQAIADSTIIQEGLISNDYYSYGKNLFYDTGLEPVYTVAAAVNPALSWNDLFWEWNNIVTTLYAMGDVMVICGLVGLLLFVISTIVLCYFAESEREKLKFIHKCPLLIYLGCVVAIEAMLYALMIGICVAVRDWVINVSLNAFSSVMQLLGLIIALVFLGCVANLATRAKTKTLFRYSELYYIFIPIKKLWKAFGSGVQLLRENISLFWKVALGMLIVDIIQFMILYDALWYTYERETVVCFVIYKIIQFVVVLLIVMQMAQLQKGGKRIANGDLSKPIDTSKMFWEFKKHGENINKVGEGISKAVENQLKSERFKTELITNVSHDIKTPLTSIINYVDLMKKEEITDPTLCEYVDVLDRQSARLKKLIEDLMEASKASTGNLKVELEQCDISMLIGQVAGEFEDRFMANGLETIITKPEEPVYVMADGRHMWRVLDNLMNNIYKYSLPSSRVYIQLEQDGDKVKIQFKNISKSQLNISSDELMERFVRGDSSRNTEGSGLGLSIAQSLTELMGGSMKLEIDGDLFKVTLVFTALPNGKN